MEKRRSEKVEAMNQKNVSSSYRIAVILGIIGAFICIGESYETENNVLMILLAGGLGFFLIGGIPYGLKPVSVVTNFLECFLFMPIVGWLVYYLIKFSAAACIGLVLLRKRRDLQRKAFLCRKEGEIKSRLSKRSE